MTDNKYMIRVRTCNNCKLCGTEGKELYVGLTDRLFSAPGIWNLKHCTNELCGLVWLDPMPMEEDIALAYQRYYTHQGEDATRNLGKKYYQLLRGAISRLTGLINEQQVMYTRYLGNQIPGKLLEIGCGSGDYLKNMKKLGWIVEGVEIDPAACRYAREVNLLSLHEGTLESAAYPDNCFDAIVIDHVIEHVYDFVGLLKECHRIIKLGGRVIVITPNIDSWGHSKFQENWRGLEPPRHIHIFSTRTLDKTAKLAGFQAVTFRTTPARADRIIAGSMNLYNMMKQNIYDANKSNFGLLDNIFLNIKALIYQNQEYQFWRKDPSVGEEIVLICQKE